MKQLVALWFHVNIKICETMKPHVRFGFETVNIKIEKPGLLLC